MSLASGCIAASKTDSCVSIYSSFTADVAVALLREPLASARREKRLIVNSIIIIISSSSSTPQEKSFTRITFVPDLAKFGMTSLDSDIVSLFNKRVYDIAGSTSQKCQVYLNNEIAKIAKKYNKQNKDKSETLKYTRKSARCT